ncbi:hypothetical protein KAFR_0C02800 [Kazachstania africana CBS 2517]|uniref:Man(5)GlcNAc(2)-PP-dolichol translocation protein RFT1 n=1 Tax=Kazachstania africana (strain ATCC 22294 / BCRC 22015 / CBS 2517 / CECT 1963 / NBRC 1671 / NRRL Y-8276) TaxID=1071382 RepID=H2ASC3_KAZAF|nr:hypothetical protein KAFR_0C02800 [Kazachstania africana CBS 2517]CCF57273.1 hypothetical protein KAFR_0C02800 [Kazachstania africana CBS 2517]
MDEKHATSGNILLKSAKGATFLVLGQLFTKMSTFLLNSLLIRFLSPRIFGITTFLEFLLNTILFFSREAIRLSVWRISDSKTNLQNVFNFGYLSIFIGIPLSIVLTVWQYNNINSYFVNLPFFNWSILIIWLSGLLELLSEPFFILNQFMLNYSKRSKFESLGVLLGCLVNFAIITGFERDWIIFTSLDNQNSDMIKEGIAIFAFAMGKLTHSLTLLCCYFFDHISNFHGKGDVSLKLTKINKSFYFESKIFSHFKKVYFQLCFKHLLTEGDKLVINKLCTVEEQGIYSLLSNYGSLITRLLFAPIEESLRLFLTKLLSTSKSNKNLNMSVEVLLNLLKFYTYLSLLIIIFGPVNSSFILQFLIGSKWSTTSILHTIRTYCFYLPFLAMNGILEAFFQSIATGDEILIHSYIMMVFSGIFLCSCWVLIEYLKLSIDGLIFSNIINMSLRIAYCGQYLLRFYRKLDSEKNSILVNLSKFRLICFSALVVCSINWCFIGYVKNFKQFFVNVLLATILLCIILLKERTALKQLIGIRKVDDSKDI